MLKKDVWVDDNAEIAADARLIGPLLISSNSHVMSGATCGPNALIVSSTVYKKTIAAGVALVHNKIVAAGDMPSSPVRMVAENLSTSEVSHTESKALELVREGRFHISQGEFLRAVDSYKAAFEIEKEFAGASGAYMDLGVALKDLAEYEEAEYYLRKSVELDTSNGDAWFNLGSLLTRKLGRHGDAVESLKNAVNCNPDDEDAICFAVEAMLRLNRTGDAIAFLDDCIRRSTRLKKVEALRIQIAADFRQWLEDIAAGRRPNI
ncbi:MAG: tetratricopeptide repeat protein [Deltaproteobacteria bacterium]|nr:tetratricopeptide repeat protein [Deltaproteobacteria bacterium]